MFDIEEQETLVWSGLGSNRSINDAPDESSKTRSKMCTHRRAERPGERRAREFMVVVWILSFFFLIFFRCCDERKKKISTRKSKQLFCDVESLTVRMRRAIEFSRCRKESLSRQRFRSSQLIVEVSRLAQNDARRRRRRRQTKPFFFLFSSSPRSRSNHRRR